MGYAEHEEGEPEEEEECGEDDCGAEGEEPEEEGEYEPPWESIGILNTLA